MITDPAGRKQFVMLTAAQYEELREALYVLSALVADLVPQARFVSVGEFGFDGLRSTRTWRVSLHPPLQPRTSVGGAASRMTKSNSLHASGVPRRAMESAKARKAKGMSQAELAKKAGVPQSQVSRIERRPERTTVRTLKRLARALGVDVRLLIEPD